MPEPTTAGALTPEERAHFEVCVGAEMYGSMVLRLLESEAHFRAALAQAERERDRLWREALIPEGVEVLNRVTARFNALRPDTVLTDAKIDAREAEARAAEAAGEAHRFIPWSEVGRRLKVGDLSGTPPTAPIVCGDPRNALAAAPPPEEEASRE
jgi:hypothetical protein